MVEVPVRLAELNSEAETVVICYQRLRSADAATFLAGSGFGKVVNLDGGLDAYSDWHASVPRY